MRYESKPFSKGDDPCRRSVKAAEIAVPSAPAGFSCGAGFDAEAEGGHTPAAQAVSSAFSRNEVMRSDAGLE